MSLPSRGAWIEIVKICARTLIFTSRSLHGERGLKYYVASDVGTRLPSLPSRGAWIEIAKEAGQAITELGRSLHGERGLKCG